MSSEQASSLCASIFGASGWGFACNILASVLIAAISYYVGHHRATSVDIEKKERGGE